MAADDKQDVWKDTAKLYSNQASRLTQLHGADLATILKNDLLQAKTVLDVGAGAGAFAHAYIQVFPKGIPGQTLILSDLSEGMLDQAKGSIKVPEDFQTNIIYQVEDGTKLEGVETDSVDIVVSLFGIFLIPDQEATMKAVKRVLKKDGVFANASWIFNDSDGLASLGFGVSLQDAFAVPNDIIDPDRLASDKAANSYMKWSESQQIKSMLKAHGFIDPSVVRAIHTTVWEWEPMWKMMSINPMSNIQGAPAEDVKRAKDGLIEFLTKDGRGDIQKPLMLSSASNLMVARGFN